MENLDRERAAEVIGEGVHTGLRKGTDAEGAHDLWRAIADLESSAWNDALLYAVDCMRTMGYDVVRVR